eukprot:6265449-Amphidinium_carterae.1
MAQELIVSIQTSAEGVTTETLVMQRAMLKRREVLTEHIASVPDQAMQGAPANALVSGSALMKRLLRSLYLPPSLGARSTICET